MGLVRKEEDVEVTVTVPYDEYQRLKAIEATHEGCNEFYVGLGRVVKKWDHRYDARMAGVAIDEMLERIAKLRAGVDA